MVVRRTLAWVRVPGKKGDAYNMAEGERGGGGGGGRKVLVELVSKNLY